MELHGFVLGWAEGVEVDHGYSGLLGLDDVLCLS